MPYFKPLPVSRRKEIILLTVASDGTFGLESAYALARHDYLKRHTALYFHRKDGAFVARKYV